MIGNNNIKQGKVGQTVTIGRIYMAKLIMEIKYIEQLI